MINSKLHDKVRSLFLNSDLETRLLFLFDSPENRNVERVLELFEDYSNEVESEHGLEVKELDKQIQDDYTNQSNLEQEVETLYDDIELLEDNLNDKNEEIKDLNEQINKITESGSTPKDEKL